MIKKCVSTLTIRRIAFCTFIAFLCICGCHYSLDDFSSTQLVLSTKSAANCNDTPIFHPVISKWIIQKDDPYRLDNVNDAINNNHYLRKYYSFETISATHYALTIYPRNEQEIEALEHIDGVSISYLPFNYRVLSNDDSRIAALNDTTFFPSCEKYVIEKPIYNEDGVLQNIEIESMPAIYAVWPVSKSLPNEYDYQIDYMIYLPRQSELFQTYQELTDNLETTIIKNSDSQSNYRGYRFFQGYVKIYDRWINDYVPINHLRIRFSLGSNIIEGYTNSQGYFSIYAPDNADDQIVFQNDKWKLITSSSESPITINYVVLSNVWVNGSTLYVDSDYYTIHMAADYFYNSNHGIPIISNETIRIRVSDTYNGTHGGEFHPGLLGSSCVDISTAIYSDKELFALVCHELGHYNHYLVRGGFFNYTSVHRLFKESYAQYTGWFICRYFYIEHNLPDYSLSLLIPRSSQSWVQTDSGDNSHYSPFFVDLIDDYNQHEDVYYDNYLLLNDDPISNVPHSILKLMIEKRTWSQMKDILDNYCNIYFTQNQYNRFVAPYNYYFQHN